MRYHAARYAQRGGKQGIALSSLFNALAQIFPPLIFIITLAVLISLFRTWSKMSSGSTGAGPPIVLPAATHGLQSVPWDVVAVEEALLTRPEHVVELLVGRADDLHIEVTGSGPPDQQINMILDQLEHNLNLPPLPQPPVTGTM